MGLLKDYLQQKSGSLKQVGDAINPVPETQPIDRYLPEDYGIRSNNKLHSGTRAEIIESMFGFTPSRDDPHYADIYKKIDETFDQQFKNYSKSREFKKQYGKYDSSGWQSYLNNQSDTLIASATPNIRGDWKSELPGWIQSPTMREDGSVWGYNYSGGYGNVYPGGNLTAKHMGQEGTWGFTPAEDVTDPTPWVPETQHQKAQPQSTTGKAAWDQYTAGHRDWDSFKAYSQRLHDQQAAKDSARRASADPTTDEGKSTLAFLNQYQVYKGGNPFTAGYGREQWEAENRKYYPDRTATKITLPKAGAKSGLTISGINDVRLLGGGPVSRPTEPPAGAKQPTIIGDRRYVGTPNQRSRSLTQSKQLAQSGGKLAGTQVTKSSKASPRYTISGMRQGYTTQSPWQGIASPIGKAQAKIGLNIA